MNYANKKSYEKEGPIAESWSVVVAIEMERLGSRSLIVRVFLIIFTRRTLSEF